MNILKKTFTIFVFTVLSRANCGANLGWLDKLRNHWFPILTGILGLAGLPIILSSNTSSEVKIICGFFTTFSCYQSWRIYKEQLAWKQELASIPADHAQRMIEFAQRRELNRRLEEIERGIPGTDP